MNKLTFEEYDKVENINTDTITEDTVFVVKVDTTNMPRDHVIRTMETMHNLVGEKLSPARVLVVDNRIDITKLSMSQLMNPAEGIIDEESK